MRQGSGKSGKTKTGRLLKRAAIAFGLLLILTAVAGEITLSIVFRRMSPALTEPFPTGEYEPLGFECREIGFTSGGAELRGYTVTPPSPRALMLIVHGAGGSSDGYEPIVRHFAENGLAVMIFDGKACGRSEGERTAELLQQVFDIRAAFEFISSDPQLCDLPLVILGHSAGGYAAAMEASETGAKAVICVSAFERPLETMLIKARRLTGPLAYLGYPLLSAREHAVYGAAANASAAEALLNSSAAALIIHGTDDESIPYRISLMKAVSEHPGENIESVFDASPEHGAHGSILFTADGDANEALLAVIDSFIDRTILPAD